jgi:hypothetical protein
VRWTEDAAFVLWMIQRGHASRGAKGEVHADVGERTAILMWEAWRGAHARFDRLFGRQ